MFTSYTDTVLGCYKMFQLNMLNLLIIATGDL